MTDDRLRELERKCRDSHAFYETDRKARNAAVREALTEGWSQAKIAEATGLTRGRINQIVKRTPRRATAGTD